MYAEFDDTLVTGNEMIDSQHKELIGKINDLLRSCENNGNRTAAVKMLNYLADYTEMCISDRALRAMEQCYNQYDNAKVLLAALYLYKRTPKKEGRGLISGLLGAVFGDKSWNCLLYTSRCV